MTKQQRTLVAILLGFILLGSLVVNFYIFGKDQLEKERNLGALQLRENIYNIAKTNGFVIIANMKGEQIRLNYGQ